MPDHSIKALIYKKALKFLARRDYSQHELQLKLLQRFPDQKTEIAEVLDALVQEKFLSDTAFTEMLIRHRASQGYGPRYVQQELKSQGIDLPLSALEKEDVLFFEGWQRKFKTRYKTVPQDRATYAKFLQYFMQKGYSAAQIKDYLQRLSLS